MQRGQLSGEEDSEFEKLLCPKVQNCQRARRQELGSKPVKPSPGKGGIQLSVNTIHLNVHKPGQPFGWQFDGMNIVYICPMTQRPHTYGVYVFPWVHVCTPFIHRQGL